MQAILLILLGVILSFTKIGDVEKKIAEELKAELKADSVRVDLDMSRMAAISRGEIKNVAVTVSGYCRPEVCVDSYSVSVHGIKFDRKSALQKKFKLKSVESIDWSARFTQDELQKYLRTRSPLLDGLQIIMEPGAWRIRIPVAIPLVGKKNIDVIGTLVEYQGGVGIHVTKVDTFGLKIKIGLIDKLVGRLNPIVSQETLNQKLSEGSTFKDDSIQIAMSIGDVLEENKALVVIGKATVTVAEKKP